MPNRTRQLRAGMMALSMLALAGTLAGCSDRDTVLAEKIAAADAAARRAEAAATRAEAAAKRAAAGAPVSETTEPAEPEVGDGPEPSFEADSGSDADGSASG